ncbi:MAG: histidine kinase [Agathobacter sp.]|nr:histidine kinase [Agathobacter sp.]
MVHYRKNIGKFGTLVMLNFGFVSVVTTGLQSIWYPVPELLVCTLALLLIFMLFYWEMAQKLVKNERELMQNQMSLAISQIQPHFLYNTLSTISELCQRDAVMAEEVTNRFSTYLRGNLEHMGESIPVEFGKELRHVQTYLWIEKIRFQDDLKVEYDIQTEDFIIPALTVQPLVENAVKHGMMGSENVCTIRIRTKRDKRSYQVIIEDDGCGFNPNEKKNDGRKHVGIESVRSRLEYMVGGTLTIHSEVGKGTRVVIDIPGKEIE